MLRPLRDQVVVKRAKEVEMTKGGLYIPGTAQEQSIEGEVVAVGTGKVLDNGRVLEPHVKRGDKVLLAKFGFVEIENPDGEKLLVVKEEQILAVLEDE